MRQLAKLPPPQARAITDHLLTLGITSKVNPTRDDGLEAVWVHHEDHLDRAREELAAFLEDPEAERYRNANREADAIRQREEQIDQAYKNRTIQLKNRMRRVQQAVGSSIPLGLVTRFLLISSVAVYVLNFLSVRGANQDLYSWLLFSEWFVIDGQVGNVGFELILQGQFWRLITPIFIHFGPIHLLFNMMMLYRLGAAIELVRTRGEFISLVLTTALVSNIAQWAFPDLFEIPLLNKKMAGGGPFGGMSGVLCGFFGYAWALSRYFPQVGIRLHPQSVILMMGWIVLCFFNILGPIANTAHMFGLMTGIAFCFFAMWREGQIR